MPIYEYECLRCGKRFELRRSMADIGKETKCPGCGAKDTRRIFLPFSVSPSGGRCAPGAPT